MREDPKASVVITTHNRASMLGRAVASAIDAGSAVEVIVVDDASTDDTFPLFSERSDIRYIRLAENQKTAGARNAGLMAASAPYVAFLDDDDWRLPGSLDKQVQLMEADPDCALVYGQYLSADQDGNILDNPPLPTSDFPEGDIFWRLLDGNFVGCLTVLFRKDVVEKVGMLDTSPEMYGIEDFDLWVRIAELFSVRALKEPVGVYRLPGVSSGQWSSNAAAQYWRIAGAYERKWLKLPRVERDLGRSVSEKSKRYFRNVSDRILFDLATQTPNASEKLKKAYLSARCYPSNLARMTFYKTIVRSFLVDGSK